MSDNYIIINGELYHAGVKGMKWGVRRWQNEDGSLTPAGKARYKYNDTKTERKSAEKDERRAARRGWGMKGIQRYEAAKDKANDARTNETFAKAKLNAAKAKDDAKAEKAEFKTYVKAMSKEGLPDSAADYRGNSKNLYVNLKKRKGQEYADKVAKKVENQALASFIVGSTVAVGAAVAEAIIFAKYS
jgi:hypothetical protein